MFQKAIELSKPWKWNWLQYPILAALGLFNMYYIESPALWLRILIAISLVASPFIPYLRRFTLPAMAIFTWLITFYAVKFLPNHIKPQHIFVNLLPTLERVIYGANLSEIISKHTHPILDIFAWIPYGVIHFAFPFIFSGLLFTYGPPGSLAVFGQAFGYMNLAGVLTQLLFPTSPPWYELSYGSAPADYSVHGQPGGLARIDDILGLNLYGTTFGNSPLVFGAFPSLHSGCATIEMLFLSWLCPKLRPYCVFHVMWMWFATMYLTHHYLIDLVGGSIYATLAFFFFRRYLPTIRPNCSTRLDYIQSKVPVKKSFANYVRSIEMEKFVLTLDRRDNDDTEALLMKEADLDFNQQDTDAISHHHLNREEEETLNSYDHVPLLSIRKSPLKVLMTSRNSGDDYASYPSASTSPTCSEPPSPTTPGTPHFDAYLQNEYKHH
ncbi:hypothetical protein INT48_005310 [Thamnidium elegans]|uniref:Phosphatidic acid phosphatase type 2/haloperoxidase domain-containing protein n=1 Tax=Thamnidium elegans TaxID=101142 RepID=A0A8H7SKM5_9FUNG|nr:hypothetical protein INT48_005310 [Thamnidium elegans]